MSRGEDSLAAQLDAAGVPYQRELSLIPKRKFRFDFQLTGTDLIVEVEGGTWSGGRHTSGVGFRNDCIKYNLALQHGYRVLRYTTDMVTKGDCMRQLREILQLDGPSEGREGGNGLF